MGSSLSPCSMWYILVTVELHGPCYGKQDIYNYEPSEVRVSTVGAWDAIFYITWSSMPAWWLVCSMSRGHPNSCSRSRARLTLTENSTHGTNCQQAVNHGSCTAAAVPNKTCNWGWHGYPAESHLYKEGIKNEKRHTLSSSTSASDLVGKLDQREDETEVLAYHFL